MSSTLNPSQMAELSSGSMTPQQKLALALLQPKSQGQGAGQYSPLQGISQLVNAGLMAGMMGSQGGPISQSAASALQLGANGGQAGPTQAAANMMNGGAATVPQDAYSQFANAQAAAVPWQSILGEG